jgi:hypothetical protein
LCGVANVQTADFKCSGFAINRCVFSRLMLFILDVCGCFLKCYEHFSKPFKSPAAHFAIRAKQRWWIWYVGFSNSSIGLFRLVCLALHIHGVCPFTRSARAKSNQQGELCLYRTIVLDCQTKTATPCSQDCIAYKTCTTHMRKR